VKKRTWLLFVIFLFIQLRMLSITASRLSTVFGKKEKNKTNISQFFVFK
tara:strand:+ start:377 stop:523 length:147 start_codon:yes stop_codon:yes gene_type:complete